MQRPGFIALELMIDKFSEFIEWLFEKKAKSESKKLNDLNSILISKFYISVIDISENTFEDIKIKLEKIDPQILEDIISMLFNISISKTKYPTFRKLRSNPNLDKRIMEIILFAETRNNHLSLGIRNVKNSLDQGLRSKSNF